MIYKILLVEDDDDVAESTMLVLNNHKNSVLFSCDLVKSISECVAKLERETFHAILLDLNLSNGKGEFTFLRVYAAANVSEEKRTPIVVYTGSTDDLSELIPKGATDIILKPVSSDELCHRLHLAILNFPFKRSREILESINEGFAKADKTIRAIDLMEGKSPGGKE